MSSRRIDHKLGWHLEDLSDFEFRLVVRGRPFTLKNSKGAFSFLVPANGKPTRNRCPKCHTGVVIRTNLVPSKPAQLYLENAAEQMRAQWAAVFLDPIPEHVEINVAFRSYRATRHRNDASNLYQAPEDAMQAAGVLVDDFQIRTHNGSDRLYDPNDPRVEIVITPYRGAGAREADAKPVQHEIGAVPA